MKEPLYSVKTWCTDSQAFTPQIGLSVPSQNVSWRGLLAVLRELRDCGYQCGRKRLPGGGHDSGDPFVLVQRVSLFQ